MNIDFFKALFSATFWITVVLAYVLYRKRDAAGARFLAGFMLACSLWTGGILMGLQAKSIGQKEISLAVSSTGIIFTPVLFLAFVLDYLGLKKYLRWSYFFLLTIFPFIVLSFSFIPGTRNWVWNVGQVDSPFRFDYTFGALLWPFLVYGYLIVSFSLFLIFRGLKLFSTFFRRHTLIFLAASLIPIGMNLLHLFKVSIFRYIDISPIGFAIGTGFIFFGIYNFRVYQIIPLAYETLIEMMPEAFLVTDANDRIVMMNNVFRKNFASDSSKLKGKHIEEILPELYSLLPYQKQTDYSFDFRHKKEMYLLSVRYLRKAEDSVFGTVFLFHNTAHYNF
ncbi:MAG TPA: histidine kinase N-terminal 7TM domain-containing protein [Prolixibacteraceae bacterium]|nr:histidine kinase N-terminal 7TM domain-containing protein [Prolixibacteraceae bacterium]